MALHRYFKPVDSLLDPIGPLSKTLPLSIIYSANEEVRSCVGAGAKSSSKRGSYAKKLDMKVKSYLQAVGERGDVLTTAITMASATTIMRHEDR